jgi:hypothetical protein
MVDYKKTEIKQSTLTLKNSIKPAEKPEPRPVSIGTDRKFEEKKVFFTKKDRENHTHVIGSTGTGKSKFLELMLRQDIIDRNCGLVLIDPHGSLYDEMVMYVSHKFPHLADRFVLFAPSKELNQVVGFNPIPADREYIDYALDMLISACLKAWGQHSSDTTPRITKWLENIFYPLIINELTLIEAAPFFDIGGKDSKAKREALLSSVSSDVVLGDWLMFESSTLTQKQMLIEGASNRLRKFLRSEIIRNIIGQKEKALNFQEIMQSNKIVLVNLNSYGKVSSEAAQLLGIMLVNEIFRCAKMRDPRDPNLKPFYLYIDEFGQFITRDIAKALEETRKYKLFLILAHQHLAQLKKDDEYLYASVLTNCKNKVVFGGLSKEDAEIMSDEIVTGFINLKSIKDEMYTTKVRHVEETRIVKGRSTSKSYGTSESETQTNSNSITETKGESFSTGTGKTETEGEAVSKGTSQSRGTSTSKGTSKGYSDGHSNSTGESHGTNESRSEGTSKTRNTSNTRGESVGTSEGETTGRTTSRGSTNTRGTSQTENESFGYGESYNEGNTYYNNDSDRVSFANGRGQNQNRSFGTGRGTSESQSESESTSDSQSRTTSRNQSTSQSQTEGESFGRNESTSRGTSQSENSSHSTSHSDNFSENESTASSEQHGTSENITKSKSTAHSSQESTTESRSTGKTKGTSYGRTSGTNESESEGESESVVPFLRPEEYKELVSRTFWTKDELKEIELGAIKNQATGEAYIKISNNPPIKTKIDFVSPVFYSPILSPKRLETFKQAVFQKNSQYYTPLTEVRQEYQQRQIEVFGEALKYDERPLAKQPVIDVEGKDVEDDNPFD